MSGLLGSSLNEEQFMSEIIKVQSSKDNPPKPVSMGNHMADLNEKKTMSYNSLNHSIKLGEVQNLNDTAIMHLSIIDYLQLWNTKKKQDRAPDNFL